MSEHTSKPDAQRELGRFEELLQVYGPRREHWPEGERRFADTLLESEAAARALLETHLEMASWLDEHPQLEPSAQLRRRVAEIPLRHSVSAGSAWLPWSSRWLPASAFGFALLLGAVSGWMSLPEGQVAATSDEWDEVSALALAEDLAEEWE